MSSTLETTITGDVGKALEALPLAVSTITAVQGDLSADQHQSVVQQGLAVTGTAISSLNALAASGLVGHNDAANITDGTAAVSDAVTAGQSIVAEFEAAWLKLKAALPWGPSPRGRGNRGDGWPIDRRGGAIPAWAGEPGACALLFGERRGHPRVGGGTPGGRGGGAAVWGPSPRGRGNRSRRAAHNNLPGAIPAWAGEPRPARRWRPHCRGHPRVGGGTSCS